MRSTAETLAPKRYPQLQDQSRSLLAATISSAFTAADAINDAASSAMRLASHQSTSNSESWMVVT